MSYTRLRLIAALTLSALAAVAAPVIAHHSVTAEFDYAKPFSFKATVVRLVVVNPHSVLEVERTNPDGTKTIWNAGDQLGGWRGRVAG